MIFIIGKTASGKDTVVKKLVEDYGYEKFVTYTTRPMRDREIQDDTYHFVSEEDFVDMLEHDKFEEYRMYHTEFGIWYYGSAKEDYENSTDKTVCIITPEGYGNLNRNIKDKSKLIYLYSNIATIQMRLLERGDDEKEAARRISSDNKDFSCAKEMADKIVYNNIGDNIDDVVKKIINYCKNDIKN